MRIWNEMMIREHPRGHGPLVGRQVRCLVARIGGYLGRNNDPPPGHQLIWQGYAALQFMSLGFALRDG